jgi:hypothetical protein
MIYGYRIPACTKREYGTEIENRKDYYTNGQIRTDEYLIKGTAYYDIVEPQTIYKPVKTRIWWNKNGNKESITNYNLKGYKEGIERYWNENEILIEEVTYKNNVKDKNIPPKYWDKNGRPYRKVDLLWEADPENSNVTHVSRTDVTFNIVHVFDPPKYLNGTTTFIEYEPREWYRDDKPEFMESAITDKRWDTYDYIIHRAAINNKPNIIRHLVENLNVDVNSIYDSTSLFTHAMIYSDLETVIYLLHKGAWFRPTIEKSLDKKISRYSNRDFQQKILDKYKRCKEYHNSLFDTFIDLNIFPEGVMEEHLKDYKLS